MKDKYIVVIMRDRGEFDSILEETMSKANDLVERLEQEAYEVGKKTKVQEIKACLFLP